MKERPWSLIEQLMQLRIHVLLFLSSVLQSMDKAVLKKAIEDGGTLERMRQE